MSISVNIHPAAFEAQSDPTQTTVWLRVRAEGDSFAAIFLTSQRCDELIEAAAAAKQLFDAGPTRPGEGDAS